jgi:hypothetical protein
MGNLAITDLKPEQAVKRDFSNSDITLKRDGTLITYKDGKLFSPRCERSDRFKHILNILKQNSMPDCYGEMYVENGNVFDVSSSENWTKAKFMPIDLEQRNLNYSQRQILLSTLVKEIGSDFITPLIKFNSFLEGWDYVKTTNGEGLVIRNNYEWLKVKILKEAKVEIQSHEPSKEKGTFILIDGNRVSGTSKDFVSQFHEIKAQGKKPIAEIEYPFMTEEGRYFQPRLRRITTQEQLKEEHILK